MTSLLTYRIRSIFKGVFSINAAARNLFSTQTFVPGTKAREAYLFVYTCGVCGERSERKISKQAYHHGVVLVKCPGCAKNHLVADNLKWFEDGPVNIESIMKEKGEAVFTGTLSESLHIETDGS